MLLPACKEITKSVNETLKPDRASVERHNQKPGANVTTVKNTTTHTTHVQDQQVIVNGDTLNTKEMQGKAKEFFSDLEKLEKNKTPGNNKEIQERVDQFLKSINLKQIRDTHISAAAVVNKRINKFF
ncbi:hypothetical protein [Pedobacter sp. NJ-S-72]